MEPMRRVHVAAVRLYTTLGIYYSLAAAVLLFSVLCFYCTKFVFRFKFTATAQIFNVDSYGAIGDGVTDDSQAFVAAWNAACISSSDSVFLVPHGKNYFVKPIDLTGPCNFVKPISVTAQISGRIIAHPHPIIADPDPCRWNPHARQEWLMFSKVQVLTISGGGIIDGRDCNRDRNHALVVNSSSDVTLRDLTFHVSPKINVEIAQSTYVQVENLKIAAPGDSPNTDGIHVYASPHVVIQNCTIATGDDSVSRVTGSSGIQINKLVCGPGQGISGNSEDTDTDVIVNGASLTASQNGVRVETWQSSAVRVPSTEIVMEGISLRLDNGDPATSFSDNVQGSSDGQVIPPVKLMLLALEATD